MPKIDDRIQTLEAKLKQLKTRQQQIESGSVGGDQAVAGGGIAAQYLGGGCGFG